MKNRLLGFWYSFPVQLLFLHFRKYQVLLVFWFILFSTVNGTFMKTFGADSLYLAPEYLGNVNSISTAIVGMSVGMFIMSWNVATFILFSRHFRFLAATSNPFLKYCLNNALLPLLFLVFYSFKAWEFDKYRELINNTDILFLSGGFLSGLVFILAASFLYFFGADRTILRRMNPVINNPKEYITHLQNVKEVANGLGLIRVDWYLDTPVTVKKPRNVSHYTHLFLETIFKRHHFAAVIAVFMAFLALFLLGFFAEVKIFQIPAAASITIFFAILIGVAAAFAHFLQTWSIPWLVALIFLLNLFYRLDWIDPRNKAYGLNYTNKSERPSYSREGLLQLCNPDSVEADRQNMIRILENWKRRQTEERPLLLILNTSGGGNRSATFTMHMLQHLDSITNGELMRKTFLITGASGGMIGATYFRELYLRKQNGAPIRLQDRRYADDIAGDLLNPLFTSFVARDLMSPAQKFKVGNYTYVKDRAYAFEMKLNDNTNGFLNKQLKDYRADEYAAKIPLMFFGSVVTRDGKKMLASTQPIRFMMQAKHDSMRTTFLDPDAIDLGSFFAKQDPQNLRLLTALRMNATFPIVLPNVWLPSEPVIDVMDAGLRDNYGVETALRFLESFDDWLRINTRGVVMIQLRDRTGGGWEYPYQSDDLSDHATKPFFLLQHNWFKMMEYSQNDMLSYFSQNDDHQVRKIIFQYSSVKEGEKAALNFHLSRREHLNIEASVLSPYNQRSASRLQQALSARDTIRVE